MIHRRPVLFVAVLLAACAPREAKSTSSATTATAPETNPDASAPPAATADASRPPPDPFQTCVQQMSRDCASLAPKGAPACPKTLEGAIGACGWSAITSPATCTYGTTRCDCALSPYCGGPAPPPSIQYGMHWSCRAPLKPDECPRDGAEAKGAACSVPGKKCAIEECSSHSDCTCTGGAWRCTVTMLPPRP